jgi:hypothetical protein
MPFVMSTAQGPFPTETIYAWRDSTKGGTVMELWNPGEPTGFSKAMGLSDGAGDEASQREGPCRLKAILGSEH